MSIKVFALTAALLLRLNQTHGPSGKISSSKMDDSFHYHMDVVHSSLSDIDFMKNAGTIVADLESGKARLEPFYMIDPETGQDKPAYDYIIANIPNNPNESFTETEQSMFLQVYNFIQQSWTIIQRMTILEQMDMISKAIGLSICVKQGIDAVKSLCTTALDVGKWSIEMIKSFIGLVNDNMVDPESINVTVTPVGDKTVTTGVPPIIIPGSTGTKTTLISPRTLAELNGAIDVMIGQIENAESSNKRLKSSVNKETTFEYLVTIYEKTMGQREFVSLSGTDLHTNARDNFVSSTALADTTVLAHNFPNTATLVERSHSAPAVMETVPGTYNDPKGFKRKGTDSGGAKRRTNKRRTTKRRKQIKKKTKRRKTYNKRRRSSSRKR